MAIYDNYFTRDSADIRSERLTALAENVGDYAVTLALPAGLVTQAQGASDAFNTAQATYTAKSGQYSIVLNTVRNQKKLLQAKYVPAKNFLLNLINNAPDVNEGYAIESGLNDNIAVNYEQFRDQTAHLIASQQRFTADGIAFLIPAATLTEIQTLQTAYIAALKELAKAKGAKINAKRAERTLFAAHSKMLTEIRDRALFAWPKDDPNFYFLGMAPEEEATGGGQPAAPSLSYVAPNVLVSAAANTTSVDIERSDDEGMTTTEIVSAGNVTSVPLPQEAADVWVRGRGRNANGTGAWSPWLIIEALTLAPILNFLYTMGVGFSWTAVAEAIRLEASYDGGITWNEIAFGVNASGTYNWTPPPGMFRIRREAGGVAGPWSVITVTTP